MKILQTIAGWFLRGPLADVRRERQRQDDKWGVQDHPSVAGDTKFYGVPSEPQAKRRCDEAFEQGRGTYAHIALEEFCEVLDATDEDDRREELVQLAAVCVAWIEAIDRRKGVDND